MEEGARAHPVVVVEVFCSGRSGSTVPAVQSVLVEAMLRLAALAAQVGSWVVLTDQPGTVEEEAEADASNCSMAIRQASILSPQRLTLLAAAGHLAGKLGHMPQPPRQDH